MRPSPRSHAGPRRRGAVGAVRTWPTGTVSPPAPALAHRPGSSAAARGVVGQAAAGASSPADQAVANAARPVVRPAAQQPAADDVRTRAAAQSSAARRAAGRTGRPSEQDRREAADLPEADLGVRGRATVVEAVDVQARPRPDRRGQVVDRAAVPIVPRPWPRRAGCTHTPWICPTREDSAPTSALNTTSPPSKRAKARPAAISSATRAPGSPPRRRRRVGRRRPPR